MADYIDRKLAKRLFANDHDYGLAKRLDEVPAADVVEVVHGRWEYHDCVCTGDGLTAVYACSNCRFCIDEEVFEQLNATDFCNCCGARMDGEG